MRIKKWQKTVAVLLVMVMLVSVSSIVLYETGVTTAWADALPANSALAAYLRKADASMTDVEAERYASYIDEDFFDQESEDARINYLVSKGLNEAEARRIAKLFVTSNSEINEYYTVDLSERQTQMSDFYRFAPENFSLIPFTEMDSVREGALGWSDALSLPLATNYIAVKDASGNTIVDLEPWMEHFCPGFTPNHNLIGEEQKYLLMGRIMTDPATGIAWLKALLRIELISGATIADLNPTLVAYRDEIDKRSYNDSEKYPAGERGLEYCLRRNSAGTLVTSPEYRSNMVRVCTLLNQMEFVNYTNDSPIAHYHLMNNATEDRNRLPERIETGETYTWGILRSKIRKDRLYDFTIWFNAGDARPGIPGTRVIPTTPAPSTPSPTPTVTPTPGGSGDTPVNPPTPEVTPTPETNPPAPEVTPTPETNPPTPETDVPTPETNPPTPETERPQKDPSQDRVANPQPGDQGTGKADTSQTESSIPTPEPDPAPAPPRTDAQDQASQNTNQGTVAPPAQVNPQTEDCYVPGSETRDDLQPAPAAQTVSGGDRTPQTEAYNGDQSTQTGQEGVDYDIPFLD